MRETSCKLHFDPSKHLQDFTKLKDDVLRSYSARKSQQSLWWSLRSFLKQRSWLEMAASKIEEPYMDLNKGSMLQFYPCSEIMWFRTQ